MYQIYINKGVRVSRTMGNGDGRKWRKRVRGELNFRTLVSAAPSRTGNRPLFPAKSFLNNHL
jgi:hypothetical protein